VTPPIVPQPEPTRHAVPEIRQFEYPDIAPPSPSFDHEADIAEKVIRDGKVDGDGARQSRANRQFRTGRPPHLPRR